LGKGGLTLKEIQQQTGARITISKRGEFAPGTQNRCVLFFVVLGVVWWV
jgi:hypothetical protein